MVATGLLPLAALAADDFSWIVPLLAQALLHFLWQGALIAAALKLALIAAREAKPQLRYAFSLVALCAMALAVPASLAVMATGFAPAAHAAGFSSPASVEETAEVTTLAFGLASADSTRPRPLARPAWHAWLLATWLLGVAFFSLRLLAALVGSHRLRSTATPVPEALQAQVRQLAHRLGLRREVAIAASDRLRQAVVVGCWRPLILAPASWLIETPSDVLEAVLAHELSHIRRGDLWVNLIQRIVETLLFYHPGVWWVSRRIRREREMCCDHLAVVATGEPIAYARALEWAGRQSLNAGGAGLAAAFLGESDMSLKQRVQSVLGITVRQGNRSWPVALATLALASFVALGAFGLPAFNASAVADDEEREQAEEREGEERRDRHGDRPREGLLRDGDRPREGLLRDGDRPREGFRRDGFREGPDRDGRRTEWAERRAQDREDFARRLSGARNEDLVRIIMELREQVGALQDQVNRMQQEREQFRDRPFIGREGPPRDRPPMGPRFDGDRREFDREREMRRDGDRREVERAREVRRDGNRREVERAREVRRDGDRREVEVQREREVRRDGDRDSENRGDNTADDEAQKDD